MATQRIFSLQVVNKADGIHFKYVHMLKMLTITHFSQVN